MNVHFWGTRGSIPISPSAPAIRDKVRRALVASRGRDLSSNAQVEQLIDELPFSVVGDFGGNTTCYEIQGATGPNEYLLFDAGSGLRDFGDAYMKAGKAGEKSVFHIFFSHVHWDHIQGFPFFTPGYLPGNRVVFHAHHESLPDVLNNQMEAPFFPVPLTTMAAELEFNIQPPGTRFSVAGFDISTIEQKHPGISYGYRFERDGKVIVFSTDSEHKSDVVNEPDYPFVAFFQDADVVVFDAQYTYAEASVVKEDWGHSSNLIGVELCSRARVKSLCMVHHDPSAEDEKLEAVLHDTRQYCQIFGSESEDPYPKTIHMAYDSLSIEL